MGIVNNVFKLILLVTKLTLLSCCVLRLQVSAQNYGVIFPQFYSIILFADIAAPL